MELNEVTPPEMQSPPIKLYVYKQKRILQDGTVREYDHRQKRTHKGVNEMRAKQNVALKQLIEIDIKEGLLRKEIAAKHNITVSKIYNLVGPSAPRPNAQGKKKGKRTQLPTQV